MPRAARTKSSTGIYHVMLRGINRQRVFEDSEDNEKYLQTIADCKPICGFELYAYCLMGNHVHLLLKEGTESLEQIFKRIGSRYVYWYNWKYDRCGHLFQDRFKSEAIENDGYFLTVLRYIHQNPVKAGISESVSEHEWSSYNNYIQKNGIVDYEFALDLIGELQYEAFMSEERNDKCLDESAKRLHDSKLLAMIEEMAGIKAANIQNEPRERRNQILRDILKIEGVSTRQLSRVTGISANTIWAL